MTRRAALFALALFPLVPGVARAQATPQGAQALETQIRDWISSTLGPNVKIATSPIRATAAGDHYDLAIPLGTTANAPLWTATARQQSGGRWAVENMRIPSPAEFHMTLPEAVTANAPPGTSPDVDYKVTIGKQTAQMLLDPSFATTTTVTSSLENADIVVTGGMAPQTSHIDRGNSSVVIQPGTAGRLDVTIDSNLEGYKIDTELPNAGAPLKIGIGHAQVSAGMSSLSRQRGTQILQDLIQLGMSMPANGGPQPGAPSPQQSAALLFDAIADLATGASLSENLQNLDVDVGGMAGHLHGFRVGFAIKGANGVVGAQLELGAEGLTLPDLGLGSLTELIPTKVSLRPVVSNLPTDAVLKILKASSNNGDPTPDDIMALFARGPIVAGLDGMTIDVAGSEFTGLGKLQIASPQDISGTAQITATHLDLLQQKIAAEPSLAQAGPVIIFLKGIGRSVGNQMVWDVTYRGGHLLVNNQDLSALAGGGGGGGAQRQSTRPQPRQPTPPTMPPSEQLHRRP